MCPLGFPFIAVSTHVSAMLPGSCALTYEAPPARPISTCRHTRRACWTARASCKVMDERALSNLLCSVMSWVAYHEATNGKVRVVALPQRAAVRWMLAREAASPPAPHPCWRRLVTRGGVELHVNTATGEVARQAPAPVPCLCGGFFCDEPVRLTGCRIQMSSTGGDTSCAVEAQPRACTRLR